MSAAADMTFEFIGRVGRVGAMDMLSALRFFESTDSGLMSCAERVSVVAYDLKVTMYTGLLEEPVMEVILAG